MSEELCYKPVNNIRGTYSLCLLPKGHDGDCDHEWTCKTESCMCGGWRWKLNSKDKTHFKQVETKLLKLRTQINRTELVLKKLADIHGGSYP